MVLQKLWVSQSFSRISRVSQSRLFSGYVPLAVSSLYMLSLADVFKGKGLDPRFFLMTSSSHLILNFVKATFSFREKGNPKLSEFHKKLENLPQRHLGARKKQLFCSRIS